MRRRGKQPQSPEDENIVRDGVANGHGRQADDEMDATAWRTATPQEDTVYATYVLFFVLNLVFIYRYMQPGGLGQRQGRCPLRSSGDIVFVKKFARPGPA